MSGIIGTALGALFGLGQQVLGNVYNTHAQQNAFNSNIATTAMQNAWNLDMWHRMNEYNDPSSQVQRYIRAGFNPNLIGGVSAGNSLSSQPAAPVSPKVAPSFHPYDLNSALVLSQISKNEAERAHSEASAAEAEVSAEGKRIDNIWKDYINSMETDKTRAEAIQLKNLGDKIVQETSNLREQYKLLEAQIGTENAHKKSLEIQNHLNEVFGERDRAKQLELLTSQIGLNRSQALHISQQIWNLKAQYSIDTFTIRLLMKTINSAIEAGNASNAADIAAAELIKNKSEIDSKKAMIWANSITEILGNVISGVGVVGRYSSVRKVRE